MATQHQCINHPYKKTSKRCFRCKNYICSNCQVSRFHHFYCSLRCAFLWRIEKILQNYKPSRDIVWFVFILFLSNLFLYVLLKNNIDDSSSKDAKVDNEIILKPQYFIDSSRSLVKAELDLTINTDGYEIIIVENNKKVIESIKNENNDIKTKMRLRRGSNNILIYGFSPDFGLNKLDSFNINYSSPRLSYLVQPVYSFRTSDRKIALTFDGGSSNRGTDKILDILQRQNIKCTMFLTGRFIENFPDLVFDILNKGHEIGNHSYDHPHLTQIADNGRTDLLKNVNRHFVQKQLRKTDSIYTSLTGQKLKPYWRAPFGEINSKILEWAAELGYRHIGWSSRSDSWDWVEDKNSELYRSAEQIKSHFLQLEEKQGLSGKIILMHLGSERNSDYPYEKLEELIIVLKDRGYYFLKISDFFKIILFKKN